MTGTRRRDQRRRKNRQNKHKKGPQSPSDERLWRRVTQHFGETEWGRSWTPEAIVAWLAEKEGLAAQFRGDTKAERALLGTVNEALAEGRKEGTWQQWQDEQRHIHRCRHGSH